jgi:hypothetical protein
MKSNFFKYLVLALVFLTLIAVGACAKPAPPPSPAAFEVTTMNVTPPEVTAGETANVTAEVKNTGGIEGTYTAVLTVDGATVETIGVALVPGASKTVTFSLVKDTPGTYQVGIGGLTSSLTVKEKLVVKEVELKYDDGTARDCISTAAPMFGGHIVDFSPPATPFTIKKIRVFGVLYGKGLEDRKFDVEILDKDLKAVYSATHPYTKFTNAPTWVEVEIPDFKVADKFYVHVYTNSPYPGLHIGADDSVVNQHSDVTVRTAEGVTTILAQWPYGPYPDYWFGDKSRVNWMIRVVGTGMMPLKPAEFAVSNLVITPTLAEVGQTVTVTEDIRNAGEIEGSYSATLKIDGVQEDTKEVTVGSGISQTVSFTFTKDAAGRYSVEVDGLTGVLKVRLLTDILKQLKVAYSELFQELLKLPDSVEETDTKNDEAIEDIAQLALDPKYKTSFESMLNEGIRDKRNYCTPLQALLWIAYDKEFGGYNPLTDYSLAKLMNDAWRNTTTSKNYTTERWLNFAEVADRLNSPQLIATYMQNNFSYSYTRGEAEGIKSAEQIFKDKKGACYDHALLAGYCLKKNGYDKAQGMAVKFDRRVGGYFTGHITCVFQDPKDLLYYIIDNNGGSRVHGPFQSLESAAECACRLGSGGEAGLASYSLHDIDLETGKYKTTW